MPIIDSDKDAKFDALIRTNKDDALMSFIMATRNISTNVTDAEKRKDDISKRLKSAYELFRENIKGSTSGAGSYGNGNRDIKKQFESHYTMGYEMGIWYDSNFHLNPLALKVAIYEITVSEYIGIVFLNLFTFYKEKYHHFLYEILKKAQETTGINEPISKDMIADTLPINKNVEQANIIFNYLIASDLFTKVDEKNMQLSAKWINRGNELLKLCNLEYKDMQQEYAKEKFKDKKVYAEYVTKISSNNIEKNNFLRKYNLENVYNTNLNKKFSSNRILFGAPGTGKSYTLNKDTKDILKDTTGSYERVTFHPNYSYGSFVGTYKPVSKGDNIRYDYIPGPFMRILVKALKNCIDCKEGNAEPQPYILIVEEINRANVAAVFGEVFQLLDRDADGVSEYSINPSEDIKKYLSKKLKIDKDSIEELRIPNNMFIWATMNSADQGVFPMDTAFKRRWDFEYIGVNDEETMVENYMIPMGNSSQRYYVKWNELRKAMNKRMQKVNPRINEDKLLGPFFISKSNLDKALDDEEKFIKLFKSKVIMYLFEDAMKMRPQEFFKGHKGDMLYSEICSNFDELGEKIFEILDLAHFDKNGNEIAKGE